MYLREQKNNLGLQKLHLKVNKYALMKKSLLAYKQIYFRLQNSVLGLYKSQPKGATLGTEKSTL